MKILFLMMVQMMTLWKTVKVKRRKKKICLTKNKFPFLHSIYSLSQGHNILNQLIKEIIQF
ncbi:MAG: hypothetical protein ACK53Y_08530, partial [bacterium]